MGSNVVVVSGTVVDGDVEEVVCVVDKVASGVVCVCVVCCVVGKLVD